MEWIQRDALIGAPWTPAEGGTVRPGGLQRTQVRGLGMLSLFGRCRAGLMPLSCGPGLTVIRVVALTVASLFLCDSPGAARTDWNPGSFADESLLEFFTVNEQGEEHWATVYFVDLDGDFYIRLGAPAERRIRENVNQPYVKVRVGGQEFENVVAEEAPEKVDEVVDLLHDKYWSSFFIKMMPDRFTVRLREEAGESREKLASARSGSACEAYESAESSKRNPCFVIVSRWRCPGAEASSVA